MGRYSLPHRHQTFLNHREIDEDAPDRIWGFREPDRIVSMAPSPHSVGDLDTGIAA
jgi:hypothetical protein